MLQVLIVEYESLMSQMRRRFKDMCSITERSLSSLHRSNQHSELIIVNLNEIHFNTYVKAVERLEFFRRPDVLCLYLTRYKDDQNAWEGVKCRLYEVHCDECDRPGFGILSTQQDTWISKLWRTTENFIDSRKR